MTTAVILVHLAATWFMVGLVWFVQIVHYPLFAGVGPAGFRAYEADHQRFTSRVVVPGMMAELGSALLLPFALPEGPARWMAWLGLGLLGVVWGSTFLLQVPRHRDLVRGFDGATHRRLVRTNWLRTIAWTARGLVACVVLVPFLDLS